MIVFAVVVSDEIVEGATHIHVTISIVTNILSETTDVAGRLIAQIAIVVHAEILRCGIPSELRRPMLIVLASFDKAGQILVVNDHGAHLVIKFRKLTLTLVKTGTSSITMQRHTVAFTSLEATRIRESLVVVVSERSKTRIAVALPLVDTVNKHGRFLVVWHKVPFQKQLALIRFDISSLALFDLPIMLILVLACISEGNLRKVLDNLYLFDRLPFERLEIEAAHLCH